MSFSLRQLRYVVAVADSGQVSAAARELFVSQSSVTTGVQEVERVVGGAIFFRNSRGVLLTATGEAFLPKARQILALADEAAEVARAEVDVRGRVRVGVTYTVMGYFLPVHIQRLQAQFPGLEVEWLEMPRLEAEARLKSGDLEFGLVLTSNVVDPSIGYVTFADSVRRLWFSPQHPLAERSEIRLADVAEHPYALLNVDESHESTMAYWDPLAPRVFVESTSIEAVRSIVANGNAVTILSDMVYRPWSHEGRRIETRVVDDPIPSMRMGLAWRRGVEFTVPMRVLSDYFHHQFGMPVGQRPGQGVPAAAIGESS